MISKLVYLATPKIAGNFFGAQIHNLLAREEVECLSRMVYEKRRRDWIAGRLATKTFIQSYLTQQFGINCDSKDIVIYNGESGEPHWEYKDSPDKTLMSKLCISISHSRGHAVATGEDAASIGIDIEPIRNISPAFLHYFLNVDEIRTMKKYFDNIDEGATLYWTLKEAATKSIKTGLRTPLKNIKVNPTGRDGLKFFNISVKNSVKHKDLLFGTYIKFGAFLISVVSAHREQNLNLIIKSI